MAPGEGKDRRNSSEEGSGLGAWVENGFQIREGQKGVSSITVMALIGATRRSVGWAALAKAEQIQANENAPG